MSFAAAQSVLDARVETRYRDFENSSNLPLNSQRTGAQTRAGFTYSYYFTPAFVVTTQTYAQREDAEVGYWADWEISFAGGFAYTFDNPLWQARYPWTFQLGGGVIRRDYDDPDPTIDPSTPKRTRCGGRAGRWCCRWRRRGRWFRRSSIATRTRIMI